MPNTKDETTPSGAPPDEDTAPSDLDGFSASPPEKRLDDKAAVLERDLVAVRSRQASERTLFIFALSAMFCVIVGLTDVEPYVFWVTCGAAIVFNIVVSRSLGAPLLASLLEPWNIRFQKAFDRHVLGKKEDEYEE